MLCKVQPEQISRTYATTVSEMHTPPAITYLGSSTIGDTPPTRITHLGRSQMSSREAALLPVVTSEERMASLEDMDATLGQASGHNTSALHHPLSPGLLPSHFQLTIASNERRWDRCGGLASYGFDFGITGSTSVYRPSTAGATLPNAPSDQPGFTARVL